MNKKTTIKIAGTLNCLGHKYSLLHPRPVTKDSWMADGMYCFFVCGVEGGKARHIIIKGDFVIDYASAGKEINVINYIPEEFSNHEGGERHENRG